MSDKKAIERKLKQEERKGEKKKMSDVLRPYERKTITSVCPKCNGKKFYEVCSRDGEVVECPYCGLVYNVVTKKRVIE